MRRSSVFRRALCPRPPSDACGRLDRAPQARLQTRRHRILLSGEGIIVMQVRAGQHFPAGTAPDGSLEPGRSHGPRKMRLTAALLTLACLAACGVVQTVSERSPARDDEWRQRQAELDAQAIMQGMAQARQRAEQLARTGR